jgi:hypothetical protein
MSDEEEHEWRGLYVERNERLYRESDARARAIRDAARPCARCGESMLWWNAGQTMHYSCDPDYPLAGKRCTCPQDCSNTHWGNGRVECDPACIPCKVNRGQPLRQKRKG